MTNIWTWKPQPAFVTHVHSNSSDHLLLMYILLSWKLNDGWVNWQNWQMFAIFCRSIQLHAISCLSAWPSGYGHCSSHKRVRVQFPEQANLTQASIFKWSVKWVATCIPWVTAVENCEGNRRSGDALAIWHRQKGTLPPAGSRPNNGVEHRTYGL